MRTIICYFYVERRSTRGDNGDWDSRFSSWEFDGIEWLRLLTVYHTRFYKVNLAIDKFTFEFILNLLLLGTYFFGYSLIFKCIIVNQLRGLELIEAV